MRVHIRDSVPIKCGSDGDKLSVGVASSTVDDCGCISVVDGMRDVEGKVIAIMGEDGCAIALGADLGKSEACESKVFKGHIVPEGVCLAMAKVEGSDAD